MDIIRASVGSRSTVAVGCWGGRADAGMQLLDAVSRKGKCVHEVTNNPKALAAAIPELFHGCAMRGDPDDCVAGRGQS